MRILRDRKRLSLTLGILFVSFLVSEELRYGRLLGIARFPCECLGGKYASAEGRCVTKACYWFDDCGYWSAPSSWRDHVSPGDSIATVVFWLGEPNGKRGETYFWTYGKPGQRLFATTFRDGRFVEWQEDANDLLPKRQ